MSPLRSLLSWLLAVAACGLAVAAITATWMHRQVMDADRWTETSVQVLRDDEVQRLAAAFLAEQVVAQQDATDRVREALPPALRGLAGSATAVLARVAERTALEALRTRALEDLWADASRTTHEQFVRWLDGKDVRREGDVVTLDLQPAVERLARRIGIADGVIDATTAATGGAEVQLVRAGQFDQTRRDAHRLEQASALALPLAIVVAIASVLLAPRRRWGLMRVGLAGAAAGLIVVFATPSVQAHLIEGLMSGGAAAPVAASILQTTTPALLAAGWTTVIGGAAVAVLTLVIGPWRREPTPRSARDQTSGRRSTGSTASPG